MATTALDSMPVGTAAPNFSLPDVLTGEMITFAQLAEKFSKGILVIFLCAHCPYVTHIQQALGELAAIFIPQGIGFVGISANDAIQYPEDSSENLRRLVLEKKISFPILFDETQEVAKAFSASCTPDFFLFNHTAALAYHGRFDASTPRNGMMATGNDLRLALEATCRGEALSEPVSPALGCSIKWK